MSDELPYSPGPREFSPTRWSMVSRARAQQPRERATALNELCMIYWYPVYGFIRRKGYDAESAKDFTQEFLSSWLMGSALERADQGRGKFRTFLLHALSDFLVDQSRKAKAQKRGGGVSDIHLDALEMEARHRLEPLTEETPERAYDRVWAETLMQRAQQRLHQDSAGSAHAALHEALEPYLLTDVGDGQADGIGQQLGMTRAAVSAALYRRRKKLRDAVLAEIHDTVQTPEEAEEELRHLFAALVG
jgi:DNA-directed RNA polymerase specialized sigma24 family protein